MKTKTALAVIDLAFDSGADVMVPLFSGGHDSLTAVRIASKHPKFTGDVYHIDTRIGAAATRRFVDVTCEEYGWKLHVFQSPQSYEGFVRLQGFPGPGGHRWVYQFIKERCVRQIMRLFPRQNVALITGCRSEESERRMGTVGPMRIGEDSVKEQAFRRNGLLFPVKSRTANKRRFWVAPCHDWTSADQRAFMEAEDLPRNPIKDSPIGMSGECFCGAFARPNEIAMIRKYAPDVAEEIDRLAVIARDAGKHCVWGTRPDNRKGVVRSQTGPLCNSCDIRAMAAGFVLEPTA